jgi:hypothetical protein
MAVEPKSKNESGSVSLNIAIDPLTSMINIDNQVREIKPQNLENQRLISNVRNLP